MISAYTAVGLGLHAYVWKSQHCPCATLVDAKGFHGLSCKWWIGRSVRHHGLNDLISRALLKANIPAVKEPSVLLRSDGKRPDGLTLIQSINQSINQNGFIQRRYKS